MTTPHRGHQSLRPSNLLRPQPTMSYPQFGYPYSSAPQVKGHLQASDRAWEKGESHHCFPDSRVLDWPLVLTKHGGFWGSASKIPLVGQNSLLFNPLNCSWGTLGSTWPWNLMGPTWSKKARPTHLLGLMRGVVGGAHVWLGYVRSLRLQRPSFCPDACAELLLCHPSLPSS